MVTVTLGRVGNLLCWRAASFCVVGLAYALTVIFDDVRMGTTIVSRNGVG
jgi:hypothetical protein